MNTTWAEIEAARMRREDEAVARRFAPYSKLGIGHLRSDLCRVQMDY